MRTKLTTEYKPSHITTHLTLLFALILVLSTNALAVTTVEDLKTQGDQIQGQLIELTKQVKESKTNYEDAISSIGIRIIALITFEFFFLICFYQLIKIFWNWRNRAKLKREHAWYVETLRKEINLMKAKNMILQKEIVLMTDAYNQMLYIMKGTPQQNPMKSFVNYLGFFVVLLILPLLTLNNKSDMFLMVLPIALSIIFLIYGARIYFKERMAVDYSTDIDTAKEVKEMMVSKVDVPISEEFEKKEEIVVDAKTQKIIDTLNELKNEVK